MKLYYSPGACSLAGHIALHEAGLAFEHERVNLKTKETEHGADFKALNPKGYVPALQLEGGEVVTENIAVLDFIADRSQLLRPAGPFGRTRQLELLAFISTELHKSFKPFFAGGSDEEKAKAKAAIEGRFALLAESLQTDYLTGDAVGVADFYLFVMMLWAGKMGVDIPAPLAALRDRLMDRESVRTALKHEGLAGR
jgi:glutathione S-transferase